MASKNSFSYSKLVVTVMRKTQWKISGTELRASGLAAGVFATKSIHQLASKFLQNGVCSTHFYLVYDTYQGKFD